MGETGGSTQCQITVEDVCFSLGATVHGGNSQPSQSALSEQRIYLHSEEASTREGISIWHIVFPSHAFLPVMTAEAERLFPKLFDSVISFNVHYDYGY